MPLPLMKKVMGHYYPIRLLKSHDDDEMYLAEDVRLGSAVALRVLHITDDLDTPPFSDAIKHFKEVLQEIKKISDYEHSHILPPLDYDEQILDSKVQFMIVMPYFQEGSLDDWVESLEERLEGKGQPSPAQVKSIVEQIADALKSAHDHEHRMIHGNLKPSQILVHTHKGKLKLKLTGFGIAPLRTDLAQVGQFMAGPGDYSAPEHTSGKLVPATDQYALALIAYRLITDHLPLAATDSALPGPVAHSPRLILKDRLLTPEQVNVFSRALATDPEHRYPSITEFSDDFAKQTKSHKSQVNLGEMVKTGVVFWLLLTVFLSFLTGGVLNAFNMLPAFVVSIASSLGSSFVTFWGFVSGIATTAGATYLKRSWNDTRRPLAIATIVSVITIALLLLLDLRLSALTDPYTHQGTIFYQDALANNAMGYDWQRSNSNGTCPFQKDTLVVTESRPEVTIKGVKSGWLAHCIAYAQNFSDFVYQVQMQVNGGNCGGITFRQNLSDADYYLFEICTA